MKNEYMKPMLAIELFTVSQSGARDCAEFPGAEVNMAAPGSCGLALPNGNILYTVGHGCSHDGESSPIVCYNNPNEASYIFRS